MSQTAASAARRLPMLLRLRLGWEELREGLLGVKRCEWMERPWRRRVRERYEAEREGRRESSSRVARQARLCVWGGGGREEASGGD